VRFIESEMS